MAKQAPTPFETTRELALRRQAVSAARLQQLLEPAQTGRERGALAAGHAIGGALGGLFNRNSADPEMERAKRYEAILADATKAHESVADPLDRRIGTLMSVADAARKEGSFDLSAQLDEQIIALQQQKLELGKLKAEKEREDIALEIDEATKDEKIATAEENLRQSKLSDENTWFFPKALEYRSVNEKNQDEINAARAQGAFKASAGVQSPDKAGLGSQKTQDAFLESAMATGQFLGELGNLKQLILDNPRVLTVGGKGLALLNNLRGQAVNALRSRGVSEGEIVSEANRAEDQMLRAGISDAQVRSALLGLAYARAKSLDPQGRLSNQDVEIAIQMFGASNQGDFRTTLAVLDQMADSSVRRAQIGAQYLQKKPDDPLLHALGLQYANYQGIKARPAPGAKPKASDMTPVYGPDGKIIGYVPK